MKTEFMSLWDGFLTDNDARVMVLAATNRPWEVDEAILRRLPRAFEVPHANASQARERPATPRPFQPSRVPHGPPHGCSSICLENFGSACDLNS